MDVKIGGGTPDFAPARQSLENMRQKLEEMKALSPWPMNPDISRAVLSNWQALLEKGVIPQMQLAQQGSLTARANMPVRSRLHLAARSAPARNGLIMKLAPCWITPV